MKIALCTPVHSSPEKDFMASLLEMVIHTARERPDIEMKPIIASSSAITVGRHSLVKHALKWGAEFLLFLDADHVFPNYALIRLLSHELAAVGCNPRRRKPPYSFTAQGPDGIISSNKESPEIEEVIHMGLGLALVRADVISKLDPPFPLFAFRERNDGYTVGEDFFFFSRLRESGVKIHVDHQLSMKVGHITQGIIFPGSNVPGG